MAERHLGLVRRIVGVVLRRAYAADREELIAAGMLGLVDATRRYDATRGTAETTFLSKRIKGAVWDHIRAAQPLTGLTRILRGREAGPMPVMVPIDKEYRLCTAHNADQMLIEREQREVIERGMGVLSGQQRHAIRLRYIHELSIAETARAMGISESAVLKHLRHGLDAMREECNVSSKPSSA
jgi:RNA polymerase sigma factor (sigma-70 family)